MAISYEELTTKHPGTNTSSHKPELQYRMSVLRTQFQQLRDPTRCQQDSYNPGGSIRCYQKGT